MGAGKLKIIKFIFLEELAVRKYTTLPLVFFCLILAACTSEPVGHSQEKFVFTYGQNEISGVLQLPETAGPHPAVIFVHGDGEGTWDSYGYDVPLQKALVAAGFAVLSWDKPGVGKSKGNWLAQSMDDRANMVVQAGKILKSRADIKSDAVGLWGISQAGWVMPIALSKAGDFAFMISVSGAINWKRQGRFYMANRLKLEGYDEAEIAKAYAFFKGENAVLEGKDTYEDYADFTRSAPPCCRSLMSKERWEFVKKNMESDAGEWLQKIKVPVLAIFGDKDLNVDVEDSIRYYSQYLTMANNRDFTIKVFKNANHSLVTAKEGQLSGSDGAAYLMILKIRSEGAAAFAPGYIDLIVTWLSERFMKD